jgi:hypothetical protein
MNAAEFNSGLWGLKQEFIYMCTCSLHVLALDISANTNFTLVPISLAVIFISFSFAFFSFPKAITMHLLGSLFYMLELAWTKLIIVTGIDNLSMDFTLDDEYLAAKRRGTIECMKLNARDQKKKAKMEKEIKEEARTQKSIEKKQELQRRTGLLLV